MPPHDSGAATRRNPLRQGADPRLDALQQLTAALVGITARAISQSQAAHELTLVQWRSLVVVSGEGAIRVGDLGARVRLSMPSASRLVKRMQRGGLVATDRDPENGRALLVRLTDHGQAITDEIVRRRSELLVAELAATGPLPDATDHVLAALAKALGRYT